jgi:tetratricopeptide (TPR) repeat protein
MSWSADYQKAYVAFQAEDYATAVREWAPLAEQGDSASQYFMGLMYQNGLGVLEDYKTAVKWYRLSAEQGYSTAQSSLGDMYKNGHGVLEDYKTALKWYRLAAKQEDADAQYNLGWMYEEGHGVPQDDKTAMKWYRLAAKQGNSDAQQRYGELVLQDIVYGSDVRALEDLGKYVETFCQRNFRCAFDKIWAYLDITGDGRLSLAEISRFQRNILKFGILAQKKKVLSQKEKNDMTGNIVAINLASIIFLPITASSVLHSFDYNNDGLLSKDEVFGETEFARLVGLDSDTLMGGVNFETLSKQLQEIRNLIPFPN